MPRRPNNPFTEKAISDWNLPKEEDNPYKALGDTLIIIPMEVKDGMKPTNIILMPGMGATPGQQMQSRLIKGKIISIGEGVVGFEKFIKPERPDLGDVVYFEAHCMKALPFGFGLIKFEHCLFVMDDDKPSAKMILENDAFFAAQQENGLNIGQDVKKGQLGVGTKY